MAIHWYDKLTIHRCERCRRRYKTWRRKARFCSRQCANRASGQRKQQRFTCDQCRQVKLAKAFSRSDQSNRGRYNTTCRSCSREAAEHQRKQRPWYFRCVSMMLVNARTRAEARGLPFQLTRENIVIPERCPVFGVKFETAYAGRARLYFNRSHSPSIDRIDNRRGYVPDNIVIVSCRANSIKSNASVGELLRVAEFYAGLERQCRRIASKTTTRERSKRRSAKPAKSSKSSTPVRGRKKRPKS